MRQIYSAWIKEISINRHTLAANSLTSYQLILLDRLTVDADLYDLTEEDFAFETNNWIIEGMSRVAVSRSSDEHIEQLSTYIVMGFEASCKKHALDFCLYEDRIEREMKASFHLYLHSPAVIEALFHRYDKHLAEQKSLTAFRQ